MDEIKWLDEATYNTPPPEDMSKAGVRIFHKLRNAAAREAQQEVLIAGRAECNNLEANLEANGSDWECPMCNYEWRIIYDGRGQVTCPACESVATPVPSGTLVGPG